MDHEPHVSGEESAEPIDEKMSNIKFTPEELEIIRINAKKYSVLGQLPGRRSPQYRTFEKWCHSTLHTSMTACKLLEHGFFQVSFSSEEGTRHALSGTHFFQGCEVPFTSWQPGFSPQNPASAALLDFPIWMQLVGLNLCFHNEECLRIFGSKFGQVLHYDDSEKIYGTFAGPRIKVLVKAASVIPRSIPAVLREPWVAISGNPFQCATCRGFGHDARACPQNLCAHKGETRCTRGQNAVNRDPRSPNTGNRAQGVQDPAQSQQTPLGAPETRENFEILELPQGLQSPEHSQGLQTPELSRGLQTQEISQGLQTPELSQGLRTPEEDTTATKSSASTSTAL